MTDLYKLIDYAIPLYCDNQSAICLAENPIFHAQTKHVKCIITSAGKKSLARWSWLWYIKMDDQVADLFTKSMSTRKFESVCCQLSIIKKMKAGIEGECWNILHQPMDTSIVSLKVFSRVKLVGSKQRSGSMCDGELFSLINLLTVLGNKLCIVLIEIKLNNMYGVYCICVTI